MYQWRTRSAPQGVDPVLTIDAPTAPLTPGETGAATVRILNSGTIVESYCIEILGAARAWASPPAEPVRLFPDSSGEAVVKLEPPAHSGPKAGTVRVGIRVKAVSAGATSVEEFDLGIAPRSWQSPPSSHRRTRAAGARAGIESC